MQATETPDGKLLRPNIPDRPAGLSKRSLSDLAGELFARIEAGEFSGTTPGILLGNELLEALHSTLDVFNNRVSRRHYHDMFSNYCFWEQAVREVMKNATVVELGCGSLNPCGQLFLFLMTGAKRGIGLDLDEVQDAPRAIKTLADMASMVLIDPKSIIGDWPLSRCDLLRNIESFNLAQMRAGDIAGIDLTRLSFLRESVHKMSLRDGEADIVLSCAFWEHVPQVDRAIAEVARITRKGGIGVHVIDGSDHWRYGNPSHHSLEFLTENTDAEIVHESNRIRPLMFTEIFHRHGFDVLSVTPNERVEVPAELRKRLAEPFKNMPDEVLAAVGAKIVTRKR